MPHFLRSLALLLVGSAALPAQSQRGIDVLGYRFELILPEKGKLVRTAATVTFTRSAAAESLRLDLLAPMTVSAATLGCGTAAVAAPFTHDGRAVTVALGTPGARLTAPPDPVTPAGLDTLCVTLRYEGEPADGLVITTDSAGRWRAFGDNWPDRARHWLASIDHPSDKALVEFVVEAPAGRTIVSNGRQRASEPFSAARGAPPRRRTIWASDEPLPTYLMVIAAAPLVEHSLGETACGLSAVAKCVPQRVLTAPEQAKFMPGNFAQADSIVSFFSRTVGPFPYPQLAHLQSSTRFGGMENAGAIFYADGLFRKPNGVSVGLVAHETAHQWFGDAVTEDQWGHVWLSEGFATYFAALYTEHAQGDSAFRAELSNMRETVLTAEVVTQRPVIDTAQADLMKLLNANSYPKGGFVLHMLRREVGDSAFFRAIRSYYASHRHRTVVTAHLRLAVERESGRDLGWFFDQWLTRPGFAELSVAWKYDAEKGQIVLDVKQGDRFAPFQVPLRLEVELPDGSRRLVLAGIPASSNSQVIVRDRFTAAPTAVRFDPLVELLGTVRAP